MHHSNRTGSTNYNKEMHGKTNPKSSAFMNQDKLSELPDLHLNKKRALDESILGAHKRHCSPTTSTASSFSSIGGNEHGGITSQENLQLVIIQQLVEMQAKGVDQELQGGIREEALEVGWQTPFLGGLLLLLLRVPIKEIPKIH